MQNDNSPDANPYSFSAQAGSLQPPIPQTQSDYSNAIFQQNGILVLHKKANLPDRCIKSNEPTQSRLKRSLYWHHPAFYLLILLHILIYIIVALIIRKSAVLWIPLHDRFKKKRIRNMIIAWSMILFSFVCLAVGLATIESNNAFSVIMILLFPVLFFTGACIGIWGCRVVYAKKIDDHFVWLKGVSPEFVRQFPEFPFGDKTR